MGLTAQCDPSRVESLARALRALVGELRAMDKRVIVLGDVPELSFRAPSCLWATQTFGPVLAKVSRPPRCGASLELTRTRLGPSDAVIANLAGDGVCAAAMSSVLCDDRACTIHDGITLFYRDNGHLTVRGSERIIASLWGDIGRCMPGVR